MQIQFLGATETVTGSKHIVKTENGFTLLLDCGLYQGMGKEIPRSRRKLIQFDSECGAFTLNGCHPI